MTTTAFFTNRLSFEQILPSKDGHCDLAMWHTPEFSGCGFRAVVRKATVHLCSFQEQEGSHGDKKGTRDGDKQDSDGREESRGHGRVPSLEKG